MELENAREFDWKRRELRVAGRKCTIIELILQILPNFKQYMKCVDEELELQILVKSI